MSGVFDPREHRTHKESLWRFVALIGILGVYFVYLSNEYGAGTGALLAALTWSFFVLCTPIADGGFIIAFPTRLLLGIRMVTTQIAVWIVAIVLNALALSLAPEMYDKALVTSVLKTILTTPWPYWSILLLSAAGTFLSIWFGDEMIDVTAHAERKRHHKHGFKHRSLIVLVFAGLTILAYYQLVASMDLNLPI